MTAQEIYGHIRIYSTLLEKERKRKQGNTQL